MLGFIEFLERWGFPIGILVVFVLLQIIGELVEVFGKTAPTFLKLRKWFKTRKEAQIAQSALNADLSNTLAEIKEQQNKVETLITEFNKHYDEDHIAKRDKWMLEVNSTMHWARERAKVYDKSVDELKELADVVKQQNAIVERQSEALELNNKMTSDLYKQTTRTDILNFAHRIINARTRSSEAPLIISREEFKKIRKTYEAYEEFLQTYGGTNGEVDDAMEVVRRAERGEYPYIEFLEEVRG